MSSTRITGIRIIATAATLACLACGPADPGPPQAPPPVACVDEDGDGLGEGCFWGRDCDDADADLGSECFAAPESDERALEAECIEDRTLDCVIEVETSEGAPLCFEGQKRCVDGRWSECEPVEQS